MIFEARLLEVIKTFDEHSIPYLVMGGLAVRYYGVNRTTNDLDLRLPEEMQFRIAQELASSALFPSASVQEGPSWRPQQFRRFQIGTLPDDREEWLEFWFSNHLLAPFEEQYQRRETAQVEGYPIAYLGLDDLIVSKETEREEDWRDVSYLEEVWDERLMSRLSQGVPPETIASELRSLRGFERAIEIQLFSQLDIEQTLALTRHPVSQAYLLPFAPKTRLPLIAFPLEITIERMLRLVEPGSTRHRAVVEAARRAYKNKRMQLDHTDKEAWAAKSSGEE